MSFFKDLKEDLAQAVDELIPADAEAVEENDELELDFDDDQMVNTLEEDPEEDAYVDPPLTPAELIGEYDYILDCLARAHEYLRQAYRLSLIDAARKHRGATVLKYAQLVDAQPYISNAVAAWKQLKIPDKDAHLLRDISPDISNSTMWQNYLFEGFFTNLIVKKRILRVMKNLEHDYKVIQKLRNALCADITGMTEADKHGP